MDIAVRDQLLSEKEFLGIVLLLLLFVLTTPIAFENAAEISGKSPIDSDEKNR